MTQNKIEKVQLNGKPRSRVKGWAALFLCVFLLWGFTFHLIPWMQNNIPVMKRLAEVVREKDIDTTAFFYSENKEFYEAERYLNETLGLAKPEGYGFDGFFFLGIVICFATLVIGYYILPNGTNPERRDRSD